MKERLSSLLNDKWLEVGILWSSAFKRLRGLEGSPVLERDLWWNYLKEIGVVYPAFEVHFLGHESEYCWVDSPLGGEWRELRRFQQDVGRVSGNFGADTPHDPNQRQLGIPKELAMKALVLGCFPDSPSLERLRNLP